MRRFREAPIDARTTPTADALNNLQHLYLAPTVQKERCPAWGQDFNCMDVSEPRDRKPELLAREYRKVFQPHECDLPEWDAAGFGK